MLAGGLNDLNQEENGGTLKWRQPYPRTHQRGWRAGAGQCSTAPLCSHHTSLRLPAPRRRHQQSYQCRRKGVGPRGRCEEPRVPQVAFGQTRRPGLELLPPGPVYRPAGPSLAVITAKCTDSTINKHTADSRGANITPNVYQLSPKL